MNLELNDEQFRTMVHKSIFESLTQAKRDELIQKGIENVLKVEHGSYDKKSELQRQFELAIGSVSREIVAEELIKNENFVNKLKQLIQEAMIRIFNEDNKEELLTRVVDVISKSLWKDRY